MAELILYAVPVGELAEQIAACSVGLTTEAQRYPAHCTLTGFFHDDDVARYIAAAASVAAPCAVEVVRLGSHADWIGLELRSPDLEQLTERFAAAVREPQTRVDDIRPKTWLHVSLAYGHQADDHAALRQRAEDLVDPSASVAWELRLYERRPDDEWLVLGSWPLA